MPARSSSSGRPFTRCARAGWPGRKARRVAKDDVFDVFENQIRARAQDSGNPWQITPSGRRYEPDYGLLQTLLAIPIDAGSGSESGRLASAIDAWVATE